MEKVFSFGFNVHCRIKMRYNYLEEGNGEMSTNLKPEAFREPWNEKEINYLLQEVMTEATALGIPYSKNLQQKITINKRAKSRFGCCKKSGRGLKVTFEIELSERLLVCDKKLVKQILAHELLHTCPNCANHGTNWKAYAQKLNATFGYQIKRTASAEEFGIQKDTNTSVLKDNYLLQCKKCGAEIARTRMSPVVKHPNNYRCNCGGTLVRIK